MKNKNISPWAWIPTLYFAQGLPYVAVMNYVQKSGYLQHRYRSLYLLALFTMGYQTFLESICRLIKNQTLVDSQHAAIGRCRIGRNRFHHTDVKLLPNDPCHFLASGIQLGYT